MSKALIFGANGQDGYYISRSCKLKGIEPIGISRSGQWIHGDVSQYSQVEQLVKQYLPAFVFHIAANSTTQHKTLFENHETISTGTLNILEAVKRYCPSSKVFITGSGVQFKNTGNPISESDEFEATSPYAIARIQSVFAARYYRNSHICWLSFPP
jgi:GDPmannose 4,6-dehydratase